MLNEYRELMTSGMDSPITAYLWDRVLGESGEDDSTSDGMGNGIALIGKRIVEWNDSGFVSSDRYGTANDARQAFDNVEHYYRGEGY